MDFTVIFHRRTWEKTTPSLKFSLWEEEKIRTCNSAGNTILKISLRSRAFNARPVGILDP